MTRSPGVDVRVLGSLLAVCKWPDRPFARRFLQQYCAQCSDHDLDMAEGVRRALRDRAAKTPRGGLQVNLYPNTYYGFAVRGDRRNQDERDRHASHARALR